MTSVIAPPIWVDRLPAYEKMLRDLSVQSRISVDTESNSLHAYREQVCLIQFSTPQTDYILDPFVFPDLSALGPLFQNPAAGSPAGRGFPCFVSRATPPEEGYASCLER